MLPLAGTGVAGYVLYRHLWPLPAAPYRYFPDSVLAWPALATLAITVPGLAARLAAPATSQARHSMPSDRARSTASSRDSAPSLR